MTNTHTVAECTPLLISGGAEIDKLFLQILLRLVMKPFKAQPELQKLKVQTSPSFALSPLSPPPFHTQLAVSLYSNALYTNNYLFLLAFHPKGSRHREVKARVSHNNKCIINLAGGDPQNTPLLLPHATTYLSTNPLLPSLFLSLRGLAG